MFFVSQKQKQKKSEIKERLIREPMIAVLLAAVNFEWTIGRCLFFLGKTPNVELRKNLSKCHGPEAYRKLWKEELIRRDSSIPPLTKVIKDWLAFKDAFTLRHRLIHGRDTCSRNMAKEPVESMLTAVDDLYEFADSMGINLHTRLPIRRVKKLKAKSKENSG